MDVVSGRGAAICSVRFMYQAWQWAAIHRQTSPFIPCSSSSSYKVAPPGKSCVDFSSQIACPM